MSMCVNRVINLNTHASCLVLVRVTCDRGVDQVSFLA